MSWDDLNKNLMDYPSIPDCLEYRRQVYNILVDIIKNPEAVKNTGNCVTMDQ